MTIRLLILFQERTFADALTTRLEDEPNLEIVPALHTRAPSAYLFTGTRADVVLLDADFPGEAAFDLCRELSQRGEAPRVILLSQPSNAEHIIRGVAAGAVGWVRKDESLERLVQVVHGVVRGETWLPVGDTGEVLRLLLRRVDEAQNGDRGLLAALTQREREVLACLADGTGSRDMANYLHMSPNTVRTHLQNLRSKLGVHSALEAVALARSHLGNELPSRRPTC